MEPVRDPVANALTVTTSHFSDWSLVDGVVLSPLQQTVEEGKVAQVDVKTCSERFRRGPLPSPTGASARRPMVICLGCPSLPALYPCVPYVPDGAVEWAVNGIPGGNATVGTIAPNGGYQAPARAPSPATVTITVSLPVQVIQDPWVSQLAASPRVIIDHYQALLFATVEVTPAVSTFAGTITETVRLDSQYWKQHDDVVFQVELRPDPAASSCWIANPAPTNFTRVGYLWTLLASGTPVNWSTCDGGSNSSGGDATLNVYPSLSTYTVTVGGPTSFQETCTDSIVDSRGDVHTKTETRAGVFVQVAQCGQMPIVDPARLQGECTQASPDGKVVHLSWDLTRRGP
jgi:hypothetical protein